MLAGLNFARAYHTLSLIPGVDGISGNADDRVLVTGGGNSVIQFGGDPSGVPITGGVTAVGAPLLYPYYPAQMFGIMGGIKAAAEYETLLMTAYPDRYPGLGTFDAIGRMGSQTFAHITIILLILLGNIAFFATLRGRSKERLKALQN